MSVASPDHCPDPDRTLRDLLQFHVGVPARMVAYVIIRIPVEYLLDWPIDRCEDLDPYEEPPSHGYRAALIAILLPFLFGDERRPHGIRRDGLSTLVKRLGPTRMRKDGEGS